MRPHAQHHAGFGGADLNAIGAIPGGIEVLAQLEYPGLHFRQLIDDFGGKFLA
ncbi:hypothetical protein D3C78_1757060 [compost metagenome]